MLPNPKVTFKYNLTKDARSWVRWVFHGNPHLPRTRSAQYKDPLLLQLSKTRSEDQAQAVAEQQLLQQKTNLQSTVKHFRTQAEPNWRRIENLVFEKLRSITKKPIYSNDFTGYLVSSGHCSYFPPKHWFMVNLKKQNPTTDIIHELFHLQFLTYYGDFCLEQGLGQQEIYVLNEALTVILNVEMKEYLDELDEGYVKHASLRQKVVEFWQEEEDMEKLLDKLVYKLKTIPGPWV